jgi:hypothetical protein
LRVGLPIRQFPTGYGVETHLNIEVPANGGRCIDFDLGRFKGNLRGYAIGVDLLRSQPPVGADDAAFLEELRRKASRPLPPTH